MNRDCVITDRNGVIENTHTVHAAVVDSSGKLLFSLGNPERLTLIRSAAKPVQALAVVETGAFETYDFFEADLALACASHNSEDGQVAQAKAMLDKIGAPESTLRCGPHHPNSEEVYKSWVRKDFEPTPITSNCSGKHVAMIAASRVLGAHDDYHLPDHPLQLRIKETFEDLCGSDRNNVRWACDGCNLPAPACTLTTLAKLFMQFPETLDALERGDQLVSSNPRSHAIARVYNAMVNNPYQVAGKDRFCTSLMSNFEKRVIGKIGADACYGVGIRASEDTRRLGAVGAVGIGVKVEDGNLEILYAVVAEILEQLQIGTQEMRKSLDSFHHIKRINTAKVETGKVAFAFDIRASSSQQNPIP